MFGLRLGRKNGLDEAVIAAIAVNAPAAVPAEPNAFKHTDADNRAAVRLKAENSAGNSIRGGAAPEAERLSAG